MERSLRYKQNNNTACNITDTVNDTISINHLLYGTRVFYPILNPLRHYNPRGLNNATFRLLRPVDLDPGCHSVPYRNFLSLHDLDNHVQKNDVRLS